MSGTVPVLVHASGLNLDTEQISLKVCGSRTLSATVLPGNAADKAVSWYSSDQKVARVDQNGTVTAVSPGTAEISAVTNDLNITASCTVTVEALDLGNCEVILDIPQQGYTYDGTEKKPGVRVRYGDREFLRNTDTQWSIPATSAREKTLAGCWSQDLKRAAVPEVLYLLSQLAKLSR
jgi:hypothetical protein